MTIDEISQTINQLEKDGKRKVKLKPIDESILNEDFGVLELSTKPVVRLGYKKIHTLGELKCFLEKAYNVFHIEGLGSTASKETLIRFIEYLNLNSKQEISELFY